METQNLQEEGILHAYRQCNGNIINMCANILTALAEERRKQMQQIQQQIENNKLYLDEKLQEKLTESINNPVRIAIEVSQTEQCVVSVSFENNFQ
ncbi:MAG: hypothetical protein J6V99_05635 [Neisseriaceae bacterium]|nr:hypothetical protein [Neisseriaceae bacterium]